MELRPGMSFEMDGQKMTYVGVQKDAASDMPSAVVRSRSEDGLHTVISPQTIAEKGSNFWIASETVTREVFQQQYAEQLDILKRVGVLTPLSTGEEGIVGIDGKEYPPPTAEAIAEYMLKNPELYSRKISQGFTQLLLVPFARPVRKQLNVLHNTIEDHFVPEGEEDSAVRIHRGIRSPSLQTRLFDSLGRGLGIDGSPIKLNALDKEGSSIFHQENVEDYMLYEPVQDETNVVDLTYTGRHKKDILADSAVTPFPGWRVVWVENFQNVPAPGEEKTIHDRTQITTDFPFPWYLVKLCTEEQYQDESGMTMDDWIQFFITNLEKTNEVVDDQKAANLIGNFFSADVSILVGVPGAFFNTRRIHSLGYLIGSLNFYKADLASGASIKDGARTVVRVGG